MKIISIVISRVTMLVNRFRVLRAYLYIPMNLQVEEPRSNPAASHYTPFKEAVEARTAFFGACCGC